MEKAKQPQDQQLPFRFYPMGEVAMVLDFGEQISPRILKQIKDYALRLEQYPLPGMIEVVPAYTTLTLYYNPWLLSEQGACEPYARLLQHLHFLAHLPETATTTADALIEIPVCYGSHFGPDLDFVARHAGLSQAAVIQRHSQPVYQVHMIGFMPGFPYLGGMDGRIAAPRKATPSLKIPAGSVGIAGKQTGIYPIESPGGWQLIGRTPLLIFDPLREKPALLKAGDQVRFRPIGESEFHDTKQSLHEP